MPCVSVIVNVRNGAATLREALDSVIAQTFADWELIAWDDCSTDPSVEIVASYSDPRIRCFRSQLHVPLGQARQSAIEMATGDWIAFLDQDDVWLARKLELQMALAQLAPDIALVYGRTVRFYPSGFQRDYDQAHEYRLLPEGAIFADLFRKSCFIAMSSAVFRRSALAAIGAIPAEVHIIPDYYLYTAVAHKFRAAAVQEVVCRYRMHPGNASQTAAAAVHHEALWLMKHWQDEVDPNALAACRRHHHTQLALAEMKSPRSFFPGFWRLLSRGSLLSQLLRPFYFVFHLVRRNLVAPYWKLIREPKP